jgi:hypothetical protein
VSPTVQKRNTRVPRDKENWRSEGNRNLKEPVNRIYVDARVQLAAQLTPTDGFMSIEVLHER